MRRAMQHFCVWHLSALVVTRYLPRPAGCVDFRRANRPPFKPRVAQLKALENCSLAVTACRDALRLPIVSISHTDIARGVEKAILSLLWQLMRLHTLQALSGPSSSGEADAAQAAAASGNAAHRSGGASRGEASGAAAGRSSATGSGQGTGSGCGVPRGALVADDDILTWANAKLAAAPIWGAVGEHANDAACAAACASASDDGGALRAATGADGGAACIAGFRDPSLGRGVALLRLLAAIQPGSVDPRHVTAGRTPQQAAANCRYVVAVARKLGCGAFLAWQDIAAVRPRMMMALLASLMLLDRRRGVAAAGDAADAALADWGH